MWLGHSGTNMTEKHYREGVVLPKAKHGSMCCRKKQVINMLFLLISIFRCSNRFLLSVSRHRAQDSLNSLKRFIGFSINPGRTRNGGLAPHTSSLSSTSSEFAGVPRQGHFSYYLIRLIVLRSWWRQALRHSREGDSLSLITLERDIQTRSLNFTLTPLQHKYLKAPFYHRNLFQLHNQQWIILLYILL